MALSPEWLLTIAGGFITLNLTALKILSNRKEIKLLKKVDEDTDKKLVPIKEKFKDYDRNFMYYEDKLGVCSKEIEDIKILTGEMKITFKFITEKLEKLERNTDKLLGYTNRTREKRTYEEEK